MVEDGREGDLISEASRIGLDLLRLSYFGLGQKRTDMINELRKLSSELHLLDANDRNNNIFIEHSLKTISSANQTLQRLLLEY